MYLRRKHMDDFKWYKVEFAYGGWGFDEYKGIDSLFAEYNIIGRRNNPHRPKQQIFMERDEAKGFVEVMNAYDENFNLTDDQENLLIKHLHNLPHKTFDIKYGKSLIDTIETLKDETYPNFFEHVPDELYRDIVDVRQEWVEK